MNSLSSYRNLDDARTILFRPVRLDLLATRDGCNQLFFPYLFSLSGYVICIFSMWKFCFGLLAYIALYLLHHEFMRWLISIDIYSVDCRGRKNKFQPWTVVVSTGMNLEVPSLVGFRCFELIFFWVYFSTILSTDLKICLLYL